MHEKYKSTIFQLKKKKRVPLYSHESTHASSYVFSGPW